MRKITFVTAYFYPHLGGVETHVMELSKLLAKKGDQVRIVTLSFDSKLPEREKIGSIEIVRIQTTKPSLLFGSNHKLEIWLEVLKNRELFLESDIVHVHDVMWWLLPLAPLLINKLYITFHGWEGKYPVPLISKLQRQFYSNLARKKIHVGKYIEEFYGDHPDLVIDGGVTFPKSIKTKPHHKKHQLVFIGRLEKENEIDKYLDLLAQLKEDGLRFEMTWVGDGSYKSQCEKLGLVTGMVKNYAQYLDQAELVFASSYLSILAAQARGKVVAAFYSHLLKQRYLETFSGQEYMIIANNIPRMKRQIEYLLSNKKTLTNLEKQARTFAKQKTWSRVLESYEKLWL